MVFYIWQKLEKMRYILILCLVFTITSCKSDKNVQETKNEEAKPLSAAQKIANAYGFENWSNVSKIDFVFNVDVNGQNRSKRAWQWQPKTNDVTLIAGENVVNYNRTSIDSTSLGADRGFINDKFWLLSPFNLIWDESATVSEHPKEEAPISKELLNKITITYSNEGGYTPGDAYDFYYGDDFLIKEWVFRRANAPEPSLITAWKNHQDFNGIKIATEHHRGEGDWKLYFTGVSVETK